MGTLWLDRYWGPKLSAGMAPDELRVIAPWVGGGFGAKGGWRVEHVAVDDAGNLLNPLIVAGQQHGGVASGIGHRAGAVRICGV